MEALRANKVVNVKDRIAYLFVGTTHRARRAQAAVIALLTVALLTLVVQLYATPSTAASDGRFHPCIHETHEHSNRDVFVYRGHHTHSNGQHHHTWDHMRWNGRYYERVTDPPHHITC